LYPVEQTLKCFCLKYIPTIRKCIGRIDIPGQVCNRSDEDHSSRPKEIGSQSTNNNGTVRILQNKENDSCNRLHDINKVNVLYTVKHSRITTACMGLHLQREIFPQQVRRWPSDTGVMVSQP